MGGILIDGGFKTARRIGLGNYLETIWDVCVCIPVLTAFPLGNMLDLQNQVPPNLTEHLHSNRSPYDLYAY